MDAHPLGQPSLFESYREEAEATPRRTGRFLTTQNRCQRVWAALASSSIKQAVVKAAARRGVSFGRAYEEELIKLLQAKDDQATTSVRAALAKESDLDLPGELVSLRHDNGPGSRAAADLTVVWEWSDGTVWQLPVNVKTGSGGVSVITLLRIATDPEWSIAETTNPQGIPYDLWLLEIAAGRRLILEGRDYYIMRVETVGTGASRRYASHSLHGLLSQMEADSHRLGVRRHPSRAVAEPRTPGPIIAPAYDVNRGLAAALLPWGTHSTGDWRVGLYCALVEGRVLTTDDQQQAFAELLLDHPAKASAMAAGKGIVSALAP